MLSLPCLLEKNLKNQWRNQELSPLAGDKSITSYQRMIATWLGFTWTVLENVMHLVSLGFTALELEVKAYLERKLLRMLGVTENWKTYYIKTWRRINLSQQMITHNKPRAEPIGWSWHNMWPDANVMFFWSQAVTTLRLRWKWSTLGGIVAHIWIF